MRVFDLGSGSGSAARDWVGFDGGVWWCGWSAGGSWLAAAGGTALLVVPSELPAGEPPIRCVLPPPEAAGPAPARTFGALAWCPARQHECLLAAMESPAGRAHLFSVASADTSGTVPRHAKPLLTVPAAGSEPASTLMHVGFVFGTWALKVLEDEQEQEQDVVGELLICCGDLTSTVAIVLQRGGGFRFAAGVLGSGGALPC